MIERLSPPGSPAPAGPYSPAVRAGDFIYVSGQVSQVRGDVQTETRHVLNNIKTILEGAGSSMTNVIKCSVFIKNGSDFAAMNSVYAEFFGQDKPARSTIVCGFVADIQVEIDCIAYQPAANR
jgi:2-iminobutanoate/2-iminopropanoate deaminase